VTSKPNPRDAKSSDRQKLSGLIRPARVVSARGLDSCDLDILDGVDGPILARGRLYQSESAAWQDPRLLRDILGYSPGTVLGAVFINNQRTEQGQSLWYVHERWGIDNPWEDLRLAVDDCISGRVVRRVQPSGRPDPVGYIVQLDVEQLLGRSTGLGIEWAETLQPDIEVFLPTDELPWTDGSLDARSEVAGAARLDLQIGDPIRALVLEICFPPEYPRVSISRLVHHQDATAQRAFEHADTLARWRFLRLLGREVSAASTADANGSEAADEKPYAGRRLLLVDDNAQASASQAEILSLMGAEVEQILVRSGAFPKAVAEVRAKLLRQRIDLALIDNNLPGRDLGQSLVSRLVGQIGDHNPVRFALLTADTALGGVPYDRDALRANGFVGMVHRPLTHQALQGLLRGEEVWEDEPSRDDASTAGNAPLATPVSTEEVPTLRTILDRIASQSAVRFALLVRARRRIAAGDLIGVGAVPFSPEDYTDALARTDLRLLVDGRITSLDIGPGDGGNDMLRIGSNGVAHWQVLPSGATPWVFGVGVADGENVANRLPLWLSALTAGLEVQQWREWAHHVSSFVQLGMAHQGLSHEVVNLQSVFHNLLHTLNRRIALLKPQHEVQEDAKSKIEETAAKLSLASQELLEFSNRQLREQALRLRDVYLPEATATIQRIVTTECREAEVALHLGTPPTLALPAPNAALVLPLVNLLVNAAKHHYRFENRRVELLFDLDDVDVNLALIADVRDNGPGLDQTALERLWEPGFSNAPDSKRRHGIGLWLARRLVEEAGESLVLRQNWRGLGAWFRLRLPIHLG
jgi:signal transduction histidine kinase